MSDERKIAFRERVVIGFRYGGPLNAYSAFLNDHLMLKPNQTWKSWAKKEIVYLISKDKEEPICLKYIDGRFVKTSKSFTQLMLMAAFPHVTR